MSNKIENKKTGFSRRNFLRTGAISGALLSTGAFITSCNTSGASEAKEDGIEKKEAKNVIILVSDGMSMGALSMADHFIRIKENRPSHWIDVYEKGLVKRGLMDMASANSLVTDSAAAGSSWGCGYRVNNGSINFGINAEEYKPINQWFKAAGKSAGCVTTTRITHATPASFSINVHERWLEDLIAEKYKEQRFEVMMGGGIEHFSADKREDGRNLAAEFVEDGYHFLYKKDDMLNLPDDDKPIMAAFHNSHLPYTIDHLNDEKLKQEVPTLAEMTEVAIKRLSKNKNGFILQVEGGRVDHAAHINDVGGIIYDQIAIDDAVKVAMDFAKNNKDTLVIITTDHGNASPSLTGVGSGYAESTQHFEKVLDFKQSNDWMMKKIKENPSENAIKEIIYQATGGIEIKNEEAKTILNGLNEKYKHAYTSRANFASALADVIANYTSVSWANNHHTSDFVELAAYGPGSERLSAFTRNTELFQLMTQAAGVKTNVPSFFEAVEY